MAHLGDFGSAVREAKGQVDDTFTFQGEQFVVVAVMPPMLALTIAAASTGKVDETEGMAAIYEAFSTCLGSAVPAHDGQPFRDEFSRFWRLAVDTAADMDVLVELALSLFQAQAGRPTEEPVGSSPGLSSTSPTSSTVSSPSPVSGPVEQEASVVGVTEEGIPYRQQPTAESTAARIARLRPVDALTG